MVRVTVYSPSCHCTGVVNFPKANVSSSLFSCFAVKGSCSGSRPRSGGLPHLNEVSRATKASAFIYAAATCQQPGWSCVSLPNAFLGASATVKPVSFGNAPYSVISTSGSEEVSTEGCSSLLQALLRMLKTAQTMARMPKPTESTIRHMVGSLPTNPNTAPM